MLPVVLSAEAVEILFQEAAATPNYRLTIDLEQQQVIRPNGEVFGFEVDAFRKHCLLNGLDDIGLTLQDSDAIRRFESMAENARPWVFGSNGQTT